MHNTYKIYSGTAIKLSDLVTKGSKHFFSSEDEAKTLIAEDIHKMEHLQQKLYASGEKAMLIIFQGMDTAGKDSCIRHIFSGINPQGCTVNSFKQPTSLELSHDFMWRHYPGLPQKGFISIFNRSYYENVLITRVHPELLLSEHLAAIKKPEDATAAFWNERFETINTFEQQLVASGTVILKFFLHISKEEQRKRLLQRIDEKDKNWKFSYADIKERQYWQKYKKAYEDMLSNTSTPTAHWYAIPADEKWFSRVVIGRILIHAMEEMNLNYPAMKEDDKGMLATAEKELKSEK